MRHPINPSRPIIPWKDEDFYDEHAVEAELRRIFDICHTCRRCFNLCSFFPKLFNLLDTPEVDGDVEKISSADIKAMLPACTFCDLCFMAKCPYIPPHPWNVDLPRVILRYRAIQARKGGIRTWIQKQISTLDRYAPAAVLCSKVSNAAAGCSGARVLMEKTVGIHRDAALPEFRSTPLTQWTPPPPNPEGLAYGERVVMYLTCYSTYYVSRVAVAACGILAYHGVEIQMVYPECCGMPLWEQGHVPEVARKAERLSATLRKEMKRLDSDVLLSLTPSCTLMVREQFLAVCPENSDVQFIAQHTWDLSEYLVSLFQRKKISPAVTAFPGGIALHSACHVQAQNQGSKARELLAYLPNTPVTVSERCSGHGGYWGFTVEHFEESLEVGKPLVQAIKSAMPQFIASECPLALLCIRQGFEKTSSPDSPSPQDLPIFAHPIEIFAVAQSLFPKEFLS